LTEPRVPRYRFDVFVSFSSTDREWVQRVLLPLLSRNGLRAYAAIDNRAGRFLLSADIRLALARSRWVVAVVTANYAASVFTFFEMRAAQRDGFLVAASLDGTATTLGVPDDRVVDMRRGGAGMRLVSLLRQRLPRQAGRTRWRRDRSLIQQGVRARLRLRTAWDAYRAALARRDLNAAFSWLRGPLFVSLHYRHGDYIANADLLSAFRRARGTDARTLPTATGRSTYLLTGSALQGVRANGSDDPDAWIAMAMGVTYRATWNVDEARRCFDQALDLYEEDGDLTGVIVSLVNQADADWESGATVTACRRLRSALSRLKLGAPRELRAIIHQDLLLRLAYAGEFRAAAQHRRAALSLGGLDRTRRSIIHANCARHYLLRCRADRAERRGVTAFVASRHARRVREHAEQAADLITFRSLHRNAVRVKWLLGAGSLALGRHRVARRELMTALDQCQQIASVEFEGDILLSLARCEMETGDAARGQQLAREAHQLAGVTRRTLQQCDATLLLTATSALAGDRRAVHEAMRALLHALRDVENGGTGHAVATRELAALRREGVR
jgi:tetratricopeptide (TPR) repeat protein